MSFKSATKVLCIVCNKIVYANEELRIGEGLVYHKSCFRCTHCNKILQNTNFSQYNGIVYCKPHFMSLFKTRGKYDDLASGEATTKRNELNAARLAEQKEDRLAATSAAPAGKAGKKDMLSILRTRNPTAVHQLIERKGLGVCFQAGGDGLTPLELAFSTNNADCGRVMLKAIEVALRSGDIVMDKPDTEEDLAATAPVVSRRGSDGNNAGGLPAVHVENFDKTSDVLRLSEFQGHSQPSAIAVPEYKHVEEVHQHEEPAAAEEYHHQEPEPLNE